MHVKRGAKHLRTTVTAITTASSLLNLIMDPSEPGDRCLPEMGLSGWMKRTMDRSYDLSDFCNSPPVDGFYYPNLQKNNNAGVAGKGNCSTERKDEVRSCTIMGSVVSIQPPVSQHIARTMGADGSMYQQTLGGTINTMTGSSGCNAITNDRSVPVYMKPMGFATNGLSKQMALGLSQQSMDSPTNSEEGRELQLSMEDNNVRTWQKADGSDMHSDMRSHPTDDSAPTPVDHIVRFTPTIVTTPADEDGSLHLVEKLGAAGNIAIPVTPDATPNSTPSVTPSGSPQVARRTGNPFFTGGDNEDEKKSKSGSWLFRPGKPADGVQSDKLYEAKIEYQQQPNSKHAKKTVRYVPRPSELRELNFWSPTSM